MTSSFLPLAWPSVFVSLSRLEFEAGSAHFPTHVSRRVLKWPNCCLAFENLCWSAYSAFESAMGCLVMTGYPPFCSATARKTVNV